MTLFRREHHADLPVLVISGDLDFSLREQFRGALAAIEQDAPRVMIDLCRCNYFDGAALSEIIKFHNARGSFQQTILAVTHPFARRLLHIVGFDEIFPIAECMHPHALQVARDELRDRRLQHAARHRLQQAF